MKPTSSPARIFRSAAFRASKERGPLAHPAAEQLAAQYRAWLEDLAPMMQEITGRRPRQLPDTIKVIGRRELTLVLTNVVSHVAHQTTGYDLNQLSSSKALSSLPSSLGAFATGSFLGFVSRSVLGLYVPPWQATSDVTALYMIQPNLEAMAREVGLDPLVLARAILFHEATHHWQFNENPWLNQYLLARVQQLSPLLNSSRPHFSFTSLRHAARGDFSHLLPGLAEVQTLMSLLEGYSDFVMHHIGTRYVPHFDQVEAAIAALKLKHQQERTRWQNFILTITGLKAKLAQYSTGKAFCEQVETTAGLSFLNHLWIGPANLPTATELAKPQQWISRINASLAVAS